GCGLIEPWRSTKVRLSFARICRACTPRFQASQANVRSFTWCSEQSYSASVRRNHDGLSGIKWFGEAVRNEVSTTFFFAKQFVRSGVWRVFYKLGGGGERFCCLPVGASFFGGNRRLPRGSGSLFRDA